jgi:Transposase, Mutator family
LEAERSARLAAGRYLRDAETRGDYRNGYYRSDLGTRLGLLCGLRVPRTRWGYRSELFRRYQRRQELVHSLVREAFLRGISTRGVGSRATFVCGTGRGDLPRGQSSPGLARLSRALRWRRHRPRAMACVETGPRAVIELLLHARRTLEESAHHQRACPRSYSNT